MLQSLSESNMKQLITINHDPVGGIEDCHAVI